MRPNLRLSRAYIRLSSFFKTNKKQLLLQEATKPSFEVLAKDFCESPWSSCQRSIHREQIHLLCNREGNEWIRKRIASILRRGLTAVIARRLLTQTTDSHGRRSSLCRLPLITVDCCLNCGQTEWVGEVAAFIIGRVLRKADASDLTGNKVDRFLSRRVGKRADWHVQCLANRRRVTWLILPVVTCSSKRLSHACASASETAKGSLHQSCFTCEKPTAPHG